MDESKIRYFVSVVRHKSFAAAAQEHHMVASTISRQIAALEEELGAPLFYREPNSIELTPAGQRLFKASSGYLRQFGLIKNNALNLISQEEDRLTVGCGPYGFALLSRLTTEFRQHDPNLEVLQIYNHHRFISQNMLSSDVRLYVTVRSVAETLPRCESVSLGIHRWAAVTHRDNPFWSLPPEQKALLRNQKTVRSADAMDPARIWMEQRVLQHRGHSPGTSFTSVCSQALQHRIALMPEYIEPWLPRELRMEQVFPAPLETESVLLFHRERATPLESSFFQYIRDHYQP